MNHSRNMSKAIDFYFMAESPPCMFVEIVANILMIQLNKRPMDLLQREHFDENFVKLNPLRKVPFVVDGNLKLGESRAIATYFVNKNLGESTSLYPKDPVVRARIDELLHYDTGVFFPSLRKLLMPILFGRTKELDPMKEKYFRENLKYLDNRLKTEGNKFLIGNEFTLADISILTGYSHVECFDYNIDEFVTFKDYLNRLKESIPEYHEVSREPMENTRKLLKLRLSEDKS